MKNREKTMKNNEQERKKPMHNGENDRKQQCKLLQQREEKQ